MAIDGSRSTFPTTIDSFQEMYDLSPSEIISAQRWHTLKLQVTKTEAEIIEFNTLTTQLSSKIFSAESLNKILDVQYALEVFFRDNVQGFITIKQTEFQAEIDKFDDLGNYNSSTQYYLKNFVHYNGEVFIALKSNLNITPTDDGINWRRLSIKGDTGYGVGVLPRGNYFVDTLYHIDDLVNYNGNLYRCIVENTGHYPNDVVYWELFLSGNGENLVNLTTDAKNNLVSAINEVDSHADAVTAHLTDLVSQAEIHGLRATNAKLEYFNGTEWKTVSGGLPVGNVVGFSTTAGNTTVTLKWKDPTDVVTLDGATLVKWRGTKILRKTGSYPANEKDGVLVVDSGVRDQYATTGFVDTGLTNGVTYYYMAFPYTIEDIYTVNATNQLSATPKAYVIYGVKIDTTNSNPKTALTYTDNAIGFTPALGNNGAFNAGSWVDKFPFNQIKPCLYNGAVNYYLNPNNYAQKADGTASDITSGADGDVMVEFPKVWWKFETIGTDLYVRYADAQVDASYKCLAHLRGTTEKDKCYISAYLGYNLSSKLRSLSGKTPTATQTIGTFRTQAQANGAGYDQMAYFPLLMLQVLFVVMFKDRDSQTALGRGYVDGNSAAIATGGTNAKGMFYGETTGKLQNKFCGLEDFYGNLRYWIDGFFSDASRNMLIGTQNFNDTGSGYTNYGQGATADIGGYISTVQGGTESGFIVKATAGSATTYYADYGYLCASLLPIFGGYWTNADIAGAFYLYACNAASFSSAYVGARLLAL